VPGPDRSSDNVHLAQRTELGENLGWLTERGGRVSYTQPGPDWWQASDGKWYAPELHPAARPVAPFTSPVTYQPPSASLVGSATAPRQSTRGWIIGGALVGVLAIAGLAVALSHKSPSTSATRSTAPTDDTTQVQNSPSSLGAGRPFPGGLDRDRKPDVALRTDGRVEHL
jgi:hypothetical protein